MLHSVLVLSFLWHFLSIVLCNGALIYNIADIPNITFDFIIIGGGGSGNVVANRLSENSKHQVLVLEAGPSNEGVLDSEVPFLAPLMSTSDAYLWNYTTVPQPGLGGRSIPYIRGHILGGSTSINYMIYTRGSFEDFDRYANLSGDQGWAWKNILPYFKKSESWTAPADNHNVTGQFDPTNHGFKGEVAVSLPGRGTSTDGRIMDAIAELGGEFEFNLDMNSGRELGVGWAQNTIKVAERSSSATAYLAPKFIKRKNLHVVVNAQVSRVIQTSDGVVPAFRGVEFRASSGGPLKTLTATKEVILSAGSIGSPHILLNSGIGDARSLAALGIRPLVDLPDVGRNLSDHITILNFWFVNGTDTFEAFTGNPIAAAAALKEWEDNRTGPYTSSIGTHVGFSRLDKELVPAADPAAGPNTPHYEIIIGNGIPIGPSPPPQGNFIAIATSLVAPSSRGSVTLQSRNPFDAPLIDPRYLATDFDRMATGESVKGALRFASASSWSDYILKPAGGLAGVNIDNEESLASYVTNNAGASLHAVGTCGMSPRGASYGVVDPDLKVKRVKGLRVVDVSVLPFIPAAHTQASAYAIGERASDLIKATYA